MHTQGFAYICRFDVVSVLPFRVYFEHVRIFSHRRRFARSFSLGPRIIIYT
jgi:hypothetical protein